MIPHAPEIAWLSYGLRRKSRDVIGRIFLAVDVIAQQRVDFSGLEAGELDIKTSFGEERHKFVQLYCKRGSIISCLLSKLIVRQDVSAFFPFSETVYNDAGDLGQA